MTASLAEQAIQTIEIVKEELIAAPAAIVFETILEQMGPLNETPDGTPLPMKIEAWPGGRWFRDLGNNTGHLWAHVQSIKPPALLEFYGPLFMSSPAISNVIYRLTEEGGITRVKFSHRATGQIPHPVERMNEGWGSIIARVVKFSELKKKETKQ
jgi:uncharacterized protein YndB with AHSA1/START domain